MYHFNVRQHQAGIVYLLRGEAQNRYGDGNRRSFKRFIVLVIELVYITDDVQTEGKKR